jgi:hypothetical protein
MKITVTESDEYRVGYVEPTRRLPVCIAHRQGTTLRPPFGMDDMPVRLAGEYRQSTDGRIKEWHPLVCRYDLQMMMTWGSYKAIRCLKTEDDLVDGFSLREALALEGENPDHWPNERRGLNQLS